jgi:hypothetical protein
VPIRRELRKFYGREWRTVIRPRILARAGNKCERCLVPNGQAVARFNKYPGWWFTLDGEMHRPDGSYAGSFRGSDPEFAEPDRLVAIVLTVAHLNHVSGDDRDENLAALCQWCHLHHDQQLHVQSARETRMDRKDATRTLLATEARL